MPNPLRRHFEQACAVYDGSNFERLDEADRVLVTIWALEGDVNNGGFDQYYLNSSGDLAFFAPNALAIIGAHTMADIVRRANALFGPSGPSPDRDVRQAQLFAIAPPDGNSYPWDALDRAFYDYPDDISALLLSYLRERGRLTI